MPAAVRMEPLMEAVVAPVPTSRDPPVGRAAETSPKPLPAAPRRLFSTFREPRPSSTRARNSPVSPQCIQMVGCIPKQHASRTQPVRLQLRQRPHPDTHPARGRRTLPAVVGDPRKQRREKPCSRRESPPIPAQPGETMTGLSRRRSRIRVPSLPSLKCLQFTPHGMGDTRATLRTILRARPSEQARRLPLGAGRLLLLGLSQPARDGVQSEDQGSEGDADEELRIGYWVLPEVWGVLPPGLRPALQREGSPCASWSSPPVEESQGIPIPASAAGSR